MISNPGRTLDTSGYMQKSIYDSTNKNKDIFSYVDSQVATRTTSAQVATQITNATASFATTSYVDTEIAKVKDRFQWRHVDIIPYDGTLHSISADSSGVHSFIYRNDTYFYYLVSLPFPINLQLYNYELHTLCVGKKNFMTYSPTSTSNPAGNSELYFFSSANLSDDSNYISAIFPNGNLFTSEPSEYRYYETHGYTSKATTNYMRYNYISSGYQIRTSATVDQPIQLGNKQYSSIKYTNLECDKVALYMGRTYSSTNQKLTWKAYQISLDYRAIT